MKRRYDWGDEDRIERRILECITAGCPKGEAAKRAGIHRTTLLRWLGRKVDFAEAFARAWRQGSKRREFRLWARHPFRGKRPPTSKRTRSFPRFGKPRIPR